MSDNTTSNSRPILHRDDFTSWHENFEAYMGTKGLWRLCTAAETLPTPTDPAAPTRDERRDIESYETRKSKASGELWLAVDDSMRDDIRPHKGDPKAMLATLETKYNQKVPGVRFRAYNDFLNLSLRTDVEPKLILSTLISDINASLSFIRRQRPDDFDIMQLDAELATMVALRALRDSDNPDYRAFVTQFLMKADLNFSDVESTIQREFDSKPSIKQEDAGALAMAAQQAGPCFLCEGAHWVRDCDQLGKAKQSLRSPNNQRGRGRGRGNANAAGTTTPTNPAATTPATSTTPTATANRATEFAGKASAFASSSHRARWLESRAATDWNTDT
ncbi:hypothetical protein FB45DRAFT_733670, partial [Roridomyces roridus]